MKMTKNETNKSAQTELASAYDISPELNAAVETVHFALGRRKTLDEAINALPKAISDLERQASSLTSELGSVEAELALSSGAQAKNLEQSCEQLNDTVSKKEIEIKRAKSKIVALEGMAPEMDEAIVTAGGLLNMEVGFLAGDIKSQIAKEMRDAVIPVLAVIAKARVAGLGQFNDFLAAAYLPDPEGFMIAGGSAIDVTSNYRGLNLLDRSYSTPETDALVAALKPVRDAIAAVRSHKPYIPLANRPTPYQIKGSNEGPGGKPAPPLIHKEIAPHGSATLKADAPYVIKGSSVAAQRHGTQGVTQEMNIAAQIAAR